MRMSLVIPALTAGGAERVMSLLANAMADRGHSVTILTTHDAGRSSHYNLSAAVSLESVDPRCEGPSRQLKIIRGLRSAIASSRPDVVVSFLNYTNVVTLISCRGLRIPVVVSERLDPRVIRIGLTWNLLRRLTYPWAACLVAQTSTAAALYKGLTHGRVRIIANPVPRPGANEHSPPPMPGTPMIVAMGRLMPQKGFDLAIRAMALVHRDFPEWKLVILGEGPDRTPLEALRDELDLRDIVHLPGTVSKPAAWLRHAGIFLMSSRSEGFPNALCEAMALGLPVISTDCPSGPADIITPGIDGLLVPPDSHESIAAGLQQLLSSEELRHQLAHRAPAALGRFEPDLIYSAWLELLRDVVSQNYGRCGEVASQLPDRSRHQ